MFRSKKTFDRCSTFHVEDQNMTIIAIFTREQNYDYQIGAINGNDPSKGIVYTDCMNDLKIVSIFSQLLSSSDASKFFSSLSPTSSFICEADGDRWGSDRYPRTTAVGFSVNGCAIYTTYFKQASRDCQDYQKALRLGAIWVGYVFAGIIGILLIFALVVTWRKF